jgi:hypothetical protein
MPIERHVALKSWPANVGAIRAPSSSFQQDQFDRGAKQLGIGEPLIALALPLSCRRRRRLRNTRMQLTERTVTPASEV